MFAAVAVRQVLGRGPGVWAVFAAGALAMLFGGVLPPGGVETALAASAPVVVFLAALFVFGGALASAGALDHLARWLLGRARRARDLPAVLFVGFGVVSAFVVNDALVVIGVPVLLTVAARLKVEARPLLLVLAFAVTVGSLPTPFGNPQNLLISVQSGMAVPIATFLRYLAVPTALDLALGAWYLRRAFAPELSSGEAEMARLRAEAPALLPRGGWGPRLLRAPVLVVFPATMVALIALNVSGAFVAAPTIPIWETAGIGAVLLLLVTPQRAGALHGVDWRILVLFAGVFVVVGGAGSGGVVAAIEHALPIAPPGHPWVSVPEIVGSSLAGSQLVSNVPWVALQIPVLQQLGYGPSASIAWLALAAGSTLAGNLTILGAASNLIVVGRAERAGVPIRLGTFVRYGLPLVAMTVGVLVACLLVGL